MSDEEWEEEEHLVLVQLKGVIDNDFLYDCKSANCRLLEIDSDEPVLQIGNYTFTGEFKESTGTHVLFEELVSLDKKLYSTLYLFSQGTVVQSLESNDDQGTKQLKYRCNTTKTLEMTRVFLVEKEKAEKEKEEVAGSTSGAQEQQDPNMDEG